MKFNLAVAVGGLLAEKGKQANAELIRTEDLENKRLEEERENRRMEAHL